MPVCPINETIGTQDTIKNITTEDLKRHYQQFFVAKNLIIALVGDVSKVKAKQHLHVPTSRVKKKLQDTYLWVVLSQVSPK
jgi:predicted Zn-dependent peptidase